ncbi:MAG TPA: nicotinate-nucleotide--dimethylbenzimidazole phosphoribosyltransferase [Sedimenticola sp.]|nr:nicotinate-nucleotide--dimethylbenzimidazole phosphoribosyltransferase [Sedimenticola sp.]
MQTDWLSAPGAPLHEPSRLAAEQRQARLTKPPGALGELESIAIRLAAMQGVVCPKLDRIQITSFAADHGVAAEGISAFPQAVTLEMVRNFTRGGAAISVLAQQIGARLEVVNLGTVEHDNSLDGVHNHFIAAGTANLAKEAAMTSEQLSQALNAGRQAVERAARGNAQIFIGGEMGIGNTTSASALACALTGVAADKLAGPGTGLDQNGINRKAEVIQRALTHHKDHLSSPLEILRRLGGFEIAALTGSYITCATKGLPALVDGFISSVAALIAVRINKGVEEWLIFSHKSAEPGHVTVLDALGAAPLLDLGMRLGEGSGAAAALPILRLACALHNDMATFAEAGVSEKHA